MKVTVTIKANELMPGAGKQEFDEVQRIEIDLGDRGGFTITPQGDGIEVMSHRGLVIDPSASNVARLLSGTIAWEHEDG